MRRHASLPASSSPPELQLINCPIFCADQLAPHLAAKKYLPLPAEVMEEIARLSGRLPAEVIDPSRWPRVERPGARG
jgi:hypothetical protein